MQSNSSSADLLSVWAVSLVWGRRCVPLKATSFEFGIVFVTDGDFFCHPPPFLTLPRFFDSVCDQIMNYSQ